MDAYCLAVVIELFACPHAPDQISGI